MRRTIWLASYPKSGNTWFRLLLANLRAEQPVDINILQGGIASARGWFDDLMLFPAGLLTHEECDRLRPRVYRAVAGLMAEAEDDGPRFVKTHDAWTITADGEPLLGGGEAAAGAILIVRDPRAVAPSLADHRRVSLDESIEFMGNAGAAFCGRTDRQHNQLRQSLPGWSGYHRSWLEQRDLPLHLVSYEALHADTEGVLRGALAFAGLAATAEEIARAVRFAGFSAVQGQERVRGFREAPPGRRGDFFRRGLPSGWRDELSLAQIARIEADHGAMMERLGYAVERPARREARG